MPFDPKKALETWKKAKPLLLLETGVSDVIRKLPANPKQTQLADYTKAVTSLETAMNNPKIRAEKKALACITQIRDDIETYLEEVKEDRQKAMNAIKQIYAVAKQYHADVTRGPRTAQLTNSWLARVASPGRMWDTWVSQAAVPTEIRTEVHPQASSEMEEAARVMTNVMKDAESSKPTLDTNKCMTEQLAEFKAAMDTLPTMYQRLAVLKP